MNIPGITYLSSTIVNCPCQRFVCYRIIKWINVISSHKHFYYKIIYSQPETLFFLAPMTQPIYYNIYENTEAIMKQSKQTKPNVIRDYMLCIHLRGNFCLRIIIFPRNVSFRGYYVFVSNAAAAAAPPSAASQFRC